jgi:hypothetical protein
MINYTILSLLAHHWDFVACERQRYQRLAVGVLAKHRSILRSDTDRMLALLRHRGVIDYQHCIAAADEFVRLNEQSFSNGAASQTLKQASSGYRGSRGGWCVLCRGFGRFCRPGERSGDCAKRRTGEQRYQGLGWLRPRLAS